MDPASGGCGRHAFKVKWRVPIAHWVLLLLCLSLFVWSAIGVNDRFTWFLEAFPVMLGIPLLILLYRRFRFTTLVYALIVIHAGILMIGGHFDRSVGAVLGPAAAIVGARAIAVRNEEGAVVGSWNVPGEALDEIGPDETPRSAWPDAQVVELDVPGGSMAVWTSPYAPFFGLEELDLDGPDPAACLERSCAFVYAYEEHGHTFMGCLQKVFTAEIDVEMLEAAQRTREGFAAVRTSQRTS